MDRIQLPQHPNALRVVVPAVLSVLRGTVRAGPVSRELLLRLAQLRHLGHRRLPAAAAQDLVHHVPNHPAERHPEHGCAQAQTRLLRARALDGRRGRGRGRGRGARVVVVVAVVVLAQDQRAQRAARQGLGVLGERGEGAAGHGRAAAARAGARAVAHATAGLEAEGPALGRRARPAGAGAGGAGAGAVGDGDSDGCRPGSRQARAARICASP